MQFWLYLTEINFFFIVRDIQSDYHQHLSRRLTYVSCALNNDYNNNNDCLLRLIAAIYRMAELQSYLQNI